MLYRLNSNSAKKYRHLGYVMLCLKKIKFRIQIASYKFMQLSIFLEDTFCVQYFD